MHRGSLAGDPYPVGHNHADLPRLQCNTGGVLIRHGHHSEVNPLGRCQTIVHHDIQFPVDDAKFEHAKTDFPGDRKLKRQKKTAQQACQAGNAQLPNCSVNQSPLGK